MDVCRHFIVMAAVILYCLENIRKKERRNEEKKQGRLFPSPKEMAAAASGTKRSLT